MGKKRNKNNPKKSRSRSPVERKRCIKETKINLPSSLINRGSTCYLNSAFQGISASNKFIEEIKDLHDKNPNLEKLCLFQELIDNLKSRSKPQMEISTHPLFSDWNKSGQQDSYELLAFVLNKVYNELRKHKENTGKIAKRDLESWLEEKLPMRYIIRYKIKCKCSNVTYSPFQSDLAFHITIPRNGDNFRLDQLIEEHFGEESIIDYSCDGKNCDGKEVKRSVKLYKPLPLTICIHLQRTFWNGLEMIKINKNISFNTELDIKSSFIMEKEISKVTEEGQEDLVNNINIESLEIKNMDHKDSKPYDFDCVSRPLSSKNSKLKGAKLKVSTYKNEAYDLVSVIQHEGIVDGGHYICYKKVDGKWFLTNDSWISEVCKEEMLNCQPYILFYEKKEHL